MTLETPRIVLDPAVLLACLVYARDALRLERAYPSAA